MEKQLCTYALKEILEEHTDHSKTIRAKEIIDILEDLYDMKISRKKLYSSLRQLETLGNTIIYDPHSKGYKLENRPFSKGEVFILCNAVHASNFISQEISKALIDKLLKTLSKTDRNEYNDEVFKPNPKKVENNELMHNIEIASSAISKHKKMSFRYMHYNRDKELRPVSESVILIEPRYICYVDGRPYLIIEGGREPGFMHFRLDRICDAKVSSKNCILPFNRIDAYEYANNKLFMFAGKDVKVTIRCKKRVLDTMIDLFGRSIMLRDIDADHYEFSVTVNDNGIVFLAQQYLDVIEIISPFDVRNRVKQALIPAVTSYK